MLLKIKTEELLHTNKAILFFSIIVNAALLPIFLHIRAIKPKQLSL
jgi:hypothetical protein